MELLTLIIERNEIKGANVKSMRNCEKENQKKIYLWVVKCPQYQKQFQRLI